MKKLCDIIDCPYEVMIHGITSNSNQVKPGDLFVAIKGKTFDGHQFIEEVIKKGAQAVLVEQDVICSVPCVKVPSTKDALISCCEAFYDDPVSSLSMIGVTGTDGKTTVSSMVYQLLSSFVSVGYLGTNGCSFGDFFKKTNNTTPVPEEFYPCLRELVDLGCKALSMEVSSEAILAGRVSRVPFDVSIFTNVTEDHLNVHKTIENYVSSKAKLFEQTKEDGFCILNMDDPYYSYMLEHSCGQVITYGQNEKADFRFSPISETSLKTTFTLTYQGSTYQVESPFLGTYNVYNLTSSIACLVCLGIPLSSVLSKISLLKPVLGRGERLSFGQDYTILLDYAHTANAIHQILTCVLEHKTGRVITVLGSAGGREKEKRGKMGKEALSLSDYVIFTMDDPRYEDVNSIIDDMVSETELSHYERIIDRKDAIYKAFGMAKENDIVCILGKGRDGYMALKDGNVPYNDYDVIASYFEKKKLS